MNIVKRALVAGTLATVSAATLPTAALAQAAAAPIIVVDMQRIAAESAAARAAQPQLQAKFDSVQQRAKALGQQFRTEAETLQKARSSMAQEAFQGKIQELQQKQQNATNQVRELELDYARSEQYVRQQILQAVNPIITQIMREKNASVALDRDATLAVAQSLDVTTDVIARLNQALPSVSINPPAQPQQQQQQQQPATKQ